MAKFSGDLRKTKKIDNHAASLPDKVELRRLVLDAIGKDHAHVFDAFAGAGQMWVRVWKDAARYIGCDRRFFLDDRERLCYVGDNRRVLRAIDLTRFNVFDLDAYGAPWEQALIIAKRRHVSKGERIGFVLTEGSGLALKQQIVPLALRQLAGLEGVPRGVSRMADVLLDGAVAGMAKHMRCQVVKRWQAERKAGTAMKYVGLVMEGTGQLAPTGPTLTPGPKTLEENDPKLR